MRHGRECTLPRWGGAIRAAAARGSPPSRGWDAAHDFPEVAVVLGIEGAHVHGGAALIPAGILGEIVPDDDHFNATLPGLFVGEGGRFIECHVLLSSVEGLPSKIGPGQGAAKAESVRFEGRRPYTAGRS